MIAPILGRVMLAFEGEALPGRIARRLAEAPAAGVTLFRFLNVRTPEQVRALTGSVQGAGGAGEPFLIAADQEGGQFIGLGDGSTPFAGNMALGAVDGVGLTERVGRAIGLEARAMGVNVVYAVTRGVMVPKGTPADILAKLEDACRKSTSEAKFAEDMGKQGTFVRFLDRKGYAEFLKQNDDLNKTLARDLGLLKGS